MNEVNLIEGETLCKECGLCCQGIFHTYAHLNNDNDIHITKKADIPTRYDKKYNLNYFSLPCPAFTDLCSIYPERPSVCAKHKCDLLNAVIYSKSTLKDARKTVEKLKDILTPLLPELQILAKDTHTNNPKALMESINSHFNNNDFKKQHTQIFINFGIFCFLVEKYFYTDSNSN